MLCVLPGQKAGGFGDQGGGYLNSPGFGSQQNASQDKKVLILLANSNPVEQYFVN